MSQSSPTDTPSPKSDPLSVSGYATESRRPSSTQSTVGSQGFSSESRRPYAILKPIQSRPPEIPPEWVIRPDDEHGPRSGEAGLEWLRKVLAECETAAVDVETRGTRPEDPNTCIVGIGVAARVRRGVDYRVEARYFPIEPGCSVDDWLEILRILAVSRAGLIAHNQLFDGMMLESSRRKLPSGGRPPRLVWRGCTFGAYHQLASEGFKGQSWGLKDAEVDLLGWPESHEWRRDDWLVERGHITKGPRRKKPSPKFPDGESEESWLARVQEAWKTGRGKKVRPNLAEMWRVDPQVLGEYCILDCIATLEIHDHVLRPAMDRFPELARFHEEVFLENNRMLIDQVIDGVRVNVPGFVAYAADMRVRIAGLVDEFRADPRVSPWILRTEEAAYAKLLGPEPERFKPFRLREPKPTKKNGEGSRAWTTWNDKRQEHEDTKPEYTSHAKWVRKKALLDAMPKVVFRSPGEKKAATKSWRVNLASPDVLRQWVYESPESPVVWRESGRVARNGQPSVEFRVVGPDGEEAHVECDRTRTGSLPTGKKAMQQWGDLGLHLFRFREEMKEHGYVNEWVRHAREDGWGGHRVHPGWISPGTITRRLVGKAPNYQQAPKSIRFMENILPDEGWIFVECDHSSVEPTVLTELTRDPALMLIYGPGANPNHDVYLTNGARLPIIGDRIRACGYDPDNPTAEGKARAKKEAKRERTIAKPIVLGKNYGMRWRKMQSELRLQCGLFLTDAQAKSIDDAWNRLYKVSGPDFTKKLDAEWVARGGWFYDGLGHPCCVAEDFRKDMISRCVQGTAHSIHMIFVTIVDRLLTEAGVGQRWVVLDWHDQFVLQVRPEMADDTVHLTHDAYRELNEKWLGGLIPIRGEPKTARNMSEAKEAEE